jgi:hypothetical protein
MNKYNSFINPFDAANAKLGREAMRLSKGFIFYSK